MILEIIVFISIVIVFVIFARHLPDIKEKAKSVSFKNAINNEVKEVKNNEKEQRESFWVNNDNIEDEMSKADALLKSQKIQEAEELYLSLATKNPSNPKIYNRLGALYLEQGNYEDAKEAFKEVIKFDRKVGSRWYNLALAQVGLKEYRSAINSLVKAVKLEKKNKKYLDMLKDVRGRLKKIKPIKNK